MTARTVSGQANCGNRAYRFRMSSQVSPLLPGCLAMGWWLVLGVVSGKAGGAALARLLARRRGSGPATRPTARRRCWSVLLSCFDAYNRARGARSSLLFGPRASPWRNNGPSTTSNEPSKSSATPTRNSHQRTEPTAPANPLRHPPCRRELACPATALLDLQQEAPPARCAGQPRHDCGPLDLGVGG